jgi:hypothetical protein
MKVHTTPIRATLLLQLLTAGWSYRLEYDRLSLYKIILKDRRPVSVIRVRFSERQLCSGKRSFRQYHLPAQACYHWEANALTENIPDSAQTNLQRRIRPDRSAAAI